MARGQSEIIERVDIETLERRNLGLRFDDLDQIKGEK